jgi:ElaB/YqjD/DUF883 family membrane-anchored ribosome-binding protein
MPPDHGENPVPAIDPVIDDAKQTLEDAKQTVNHAKKTVKTGQKQAPEIVRETKSAFSDRAEQARAQANQAADYAAEQLEQARLLAAEQLETARLFLTDRMQERPLTSALAAIGFGFVLGVLLSGRRR